MKKIERSALVAFSAQQMYELVADFESYPKYMAGCVGTASIGRGDSWLEARLDFARGGIRQSIVTHNILNPPHSMLITLVDGPFSHFEGEWKFTALSDSACKVEYRMEFEFSNRLLGFAAGKLFEHVASEQVDALCRRAKQIYA